MEPKLTGYDLEDYFNKAREHFGKPVIEADEYEELGDAYAAHENFFAAAGCYAMASVRTLPAREEAVRLLDRAAEALARTSADLHALIR